MAKAEMRKAKAEMRNAEGERSWIVSDKTHLWWRVG